MFSVDIDAPDLRRFSAEVEGVAQSLGDFRAASRQAASLVLGDVRPPRRTGALASTVEAIPNALGFTLQAGGPKAPYGPIVHARDPFLSRPLTAREEGVLGIYADDVDTILSTITT